MKQFCLLGVFLLLGTTVLAADKKTAAEDAAKVGGRQAFDVHAPLGSKLAQVRARVVRGTAAEQQHRADIDHWISNSVAKSGSPLALPYSGWVTLRGDHQRIYTSKQGGFIIDAKATQQGGRYAVELEACAGISLDQKATLRPGERRVIKMTDAAAPHNVFVALEAPVSEKAKVRAGAMKANAKSFRLELNYAGEQGKPFYQMIVSVPVVNRRRNSAFHRIVQVNKEQAARIIDHLAQRFFDQALDLSTKIKIPPPTKPGYTLKVTNENTRWYGDLGWGLPMIHRLDALHNALPDGGQQEMDLVLGRLSGLRKQWEAKHPPFVAADGRAGSRVQFSSEDDTTIIDITSTFGIDRTTIKRESPGWPKSILVRLHLAGLELFNVGNGEISVDWSVESTGDNASRVYLRTGGEETALDRKSPYYAPVRIVGGGNRTIPLKDGWFEVSLPVKLFEKNPDAITLKWIDFYRN